MIYPAQKDWRAPIEPVPPGCPVFGDDSVVVRPPKAPAKSRVVAPGLHRAAGRRSSSCVVGSGAAQARRARDDGPAAASVADGRQGRAGGLARRARIRAMEGAPRRDAGGGGGGDLSGRHRDRTCRADCRARRAPCVARRSGSDRGRTRRARRRASAWRALRDAGPRHTFARRARCERGGDRRGGPLFCPDARARTIWRLLPRARPRPQR